MLPTIQYFIISAKYQDMSYGFGFSSDSKSNNFVRISLFGPSYRTFLISVSLRLASPCIDHLLYTEIKHLMSFVEPDLHIATETLFICDTSPDANKHINNTMSTVTSPKLFAKHFPKPRISFSLNLFHCIYRLKLLLSLRFIITVDLL